MSYQYLGIIFALVALISWGFGDFFIQRSVRKFGDWESLFIIALVGSIILFPFVIKDIVTVVTFSVVEIVSLLLVAFSFLLSALINTEALKRGKLAVVESVGAIEIPIAGILSYIILREKIVSFHWIFVALLILGILLVAVKPHHFRKETWIEKGALLGISGAIIMGTTDFMVGLGSRTTNPILTVWVFNIVMVIAALLYLGSTGRLGHFWRDFRLHRNLMVGVGVLDNLAWLAFAISTQFIPIVVALVLSESYIILATLLGIFVNREKLRGYQKVGMVCAICGMLVLGILYS